MIVNRDKAKHCFNAGCDIVIKCKGEWLAWNNRQYTEGFECLMAFVYKGEEVVYKIVGVTNSNLSKMKRGY